MINIGALDRRITLVSANAEPAEVWAGKRDLSDGRTSFLIRYRIIDASTKVLFDGKTYKIERVLEVGRKDGLSLKAIEVTE
ncbi:hypothetical protein B9J07_28125 [Sinorhizobium sp. LM21]|uniref:head-tail adaptor protein n=1 Tax=Sinorhizobium sp. LM21 TaxID=1449788 RepID=UPI0005D8FD38|nr:head-tail adaptor protein [Sinorhizobium sp. LM21]AJW30140.1 head-tail adaptor protein [Sinorhizobium sp. LM21]OWZ90455.1 hypothetical protein B9J07_28125 [Sinorhizobium sp. LM21]